MRTSASRRIAALLALIVLAACEGVTPPATAPAPSAVDPGARHSVTGPRAPLGDLLANPVFMELQPIPREIETRDQSAVASSTSSALSPGARSNAMAATATSVFVDFERYSVEAKAWLVATGDSAFFRDLTLALVQDLDGASNGDVWTIQATLPDGTLFDYPAVTYYASWNGQYSCFVATSGANVCGVTGIRLYAVKQIQCGQTGMWKFRMKYNGVQYDQREAKVVAKIDESFVPLLAQGSSVWGPNLYAHACPSVVMNAAGKKMTTSVICPDTASNHYTIHGKGCALTSAAMLIGYHGGSALPGGMNAWLRDNTGYAIASIKFDRAAAYGASNGATGLSFFGDDSYFRNTSVETLKGLLCKYGPQVLAVKGMSHFVVAYGYDETNSTVVIHDPAGGVSRDLRYYGNKFDGIRPFSGPARKVTLFSRLTINFFSPVEAVLTDPLGRRTGRDPRTGVTYAEIPISYADSAFSDNDDDPSAPLDESIKELSVSTPVAGTYTVTVVGTAVGVYSAVFSMNGNAQDASAAQTLENVPTSPGEVHTYQFTYDPTSSTPTIFIQGGFQGGGQNAEVDDFLTYVAPTSRQTSLPAGTTSTRVMIVYGPTIFPGTFHATLEGADVTASFHPAPGSRETVILPLVAGRNVLKLTVDGLKGTHTASDQDQLVFIVK